MTRDALLGKLGHPRRAGRHYMARCPAHDDRSPSLSIREGKFGLLIRCWAGCSIEQVCDALGIELADLFYDKPSIPSRNLPRGEPRRPTIRELEYQVWVRATSLDLRALSVLDAAKGLDVSGWTPEDRDVAMRAVCQARADCRVAEALHGLAYAMRETLNPRRGVADEDRTRVA